MSRGTLDPAAGIQISPTGLSPSLAGFPKTIPLSSYHDVRSPNPGLHAIRFGLFPVRSPLLRKSLVVFSSSGYLDVSVHRVPPAYLWIQYTVTGVFPAGFPHSEIGGSMDICSSPPLIAAYHVFLRLLVPRHPPCALLCLTFCSRVCAIIHRHGSLNEYLVLVLKNRFFKSVKLNLKY